MDTQAIKNKENKQVKNLSGMIPASKKIEFKTLCSHRDVEIGVALERLVDLALANPSIIEAQK